jgi:hypothetical protein
MQMIGGTSTRICSRCLCVTDFSALNEIALAELGGPLFHDRALLDSTWCSNLFFQNPVCPWRSHAGANVPETYDLDRPPARVFQQANSPLQLRSRFNRKDQHSSEGAAFFRSSSFCTGGQVNNLSARFYINRRNGPRAPLENEERCPCPQHGREFCLKVRVDVRTGGT